VKKIGKEGPASPKKTTRGARGGEKGEGGEAQEETRRGCGRLRVVVFKNVVGRATQGSARKGKGTARS